MGYVDPHVVILSETCLRQKQDANPNRDHREWMSHVIPPDGDAVVGNFDSDE